MNASTAGPHPALEAAVARIIPSDSHSGAREAGTAGFVAARLAQEAAADRPGILAGLDLAEAAALERANGGFIALDAAGQDAVLGLFAEQDWFRRLCDLAQEGFYADQGNGGNAGNVSWTMIGYDPRLLDAPAPRMSFAAFRETEPDDVIYDAVVVGAGAGGGIAACVLAEAGKRVLLLERGDAYGYDISGRRDHLRNHRNMVYGHNTGPDPEGHPRVLVDPQGVEHVARPTDRLYHSNAAGPGSGTAIYGGQAWRFHPDDFRMASRYGVPAGSSLADVVRVTYILPKAEDFKPCWPILRKYFGEARPAATMFAAALVDPRLKIEIEVTARKRS